MIIVLKKLKPYLGKQEQRTQEKFRGKNSLLTYMVQTTWFKSSC